MGYSLTFTHRGWFGLCPVRIARLDSPCPVLEAAHWSLEWLMDLSEVLLCAAAWVHAQLDPAYEPEWPIWLAAEIVPPLVKRYDDDDNEI